MPVTIQRPGLVTFQDTLYELRADGIVYKYLGTPKQWERMGGNANVTQVAVTRNGLYMNDTKDHATYWLRISDKTWKTIDRIPERKNLAASAKFIYKIHTEQGRIYQYSSKDWNVVDDGENAIAIAVGEDDTLYQLHSDGRISKYLGSDGWKEIDSTPNVQSILVGGGKLYKVHKDNSVYVHVEDYDWDRIDKSSDTVQVAAGPAGIFQRRGDGGLWRYVEADKKWDKISGSVATHMDIAVGSTVYVRHSSGSIFQYNMTANNWTALT